MKKAPINLANIIAYITGKLRYKLYYSKYKFLIRTHIREQIDFRIKVMDKECYENGECVICGCQTTALQMANKPCDKPCYPPMMTKDEWLMFSKYGGMYSSGGIDWRFYNENVPGILFPYLSRRENNVITESFLKI